MRRLATAAVAAVLLTGGLSAGAAPATAAPSAAPVAAELTAQVARSAGDRVQALLMLPNPDRYDGDPATAVQRIRAHARALQDEVEIALEKQAQTRGDVTIVNRFWITNMLLVEFTADDSRLSALAATPGVRRVLPNFTLSLPDDEFRAAQGPAATIVDGRITWGMDRIGVERVWNELGLDGSGVRVVTLDTGVAINHPDLVGKMATDNPADPTYPGGWMEFNSSGGLVSSQPRDSSTHGTHVSGTIHGGDASGVIIGGAPGAEMAHGLVIPGGSGSFAQVVAGMQWAIAPTDAAGNPAGRPADVVNMSLGAATYAQEMIAPTRAIVAAGAFPAFAIGNASLGSCGVGSSSPGNVYEAIGVGATDVNDNVAAFSCGNVVSKSSWADPPASWPATYVTPDLSAPGDQVWSASPDGGYRYASGTSMATPHTSAVAALVSQGAPELTVEQMRSALADTAFWDDRYAAQPPDTRYGHGRIDAYAAVSSVALDSGVTGVVTAAGSGDPVAGAAVTVTPGGNTVTTGADGRYTLRLAPGTYELTVSAFAHEPRTVTGVTVTEEAFTEVNVAITALPVGTITGTATFDESGHGIPGVTVTVLGLPVERTAVTGVDGTYSIEVPSGTYRVAAEHPVFGGPDPVEVTVPDAGSATANFVFTAPPQTVAIVGDYAQSYVDFFAPRGVETVVYDWPQLVDAAQHPLVILAYGVASDYKADVFQAFLDATDASGAGVIFTDHAFGPASGIRQLSQHTGQPESTGSNSGGSGVAESFYEVTADHPVFDGFTVGDRIPLDTSTQAKWIAWFNGYGGEGRQTIADMGRTDATGIYGGGIGVDQRATNRHVLMSSHGVSVTRGTDDWTPEAQQLFLNAVGWAARPADPGQPYFAVHNLEVGPDVVKSDEQVTVSVEVKNIGVADGSYNAVLRVNGQTEKSTTVNIASGANREISWTVSRRDLGTYTVSVEYLSDTFRVRPPRVTLTARTVDGPDTDPAPLAGAVVELLHDGDILPVGSTADDGTLTFETPAPVDRYTLIVRRPSGPEGEAYLLHKEITIFDDDEVVFAPRVLAGGTAVAAIEQDFVTRVNLAADVVDDAHESTLYLRAASIAPWAYPYAPGTLVASLDTYEAVAVHQAPRLERDWWLVTEIIDGLNWIDPFDQTFSFGGKAKVDLADERTDAGLSVDWDVTDAHGHPFATVLATDLRPFADLPDSIELEGVVGAVRALAPNEQRPILRLFAPDGTPLRAGFITWSAQPYPITIDQPRPGAYRLELEVDTGFHSGVVSATTSAVLLDAAVLTAAYPGSVHVEEWFRHDVRVGNPSAVDLGTADWTVSVAHPGGNLRPRDVVVQVRVGDTWERVTLTAQGDRLVGTVRAGVALAAGSNQTWKLRTKLLRDGAFTVEHRLAGATASANAAAVVQVVPAGAPMDLIGA